MYFLSGSQRMENDRVQKCVFCLKLYFYNERRAGSTYKGWYVCVCVCKERFVYLYSESIQEAVNASDQLLSLAG